MVPADQDMTLFIKDSIRSVWALELLLLLRRDSDRWWGIDDLVSELRASQSLVAANLATFERNGLAVKDEAGGYRYAPANPILDHLCATLEGDYRERPVATINLIVRSAADSVQLLADAFKFRGDSQ